MWRCPARRQTEKPNGQQQLIRRSELNFWSVQVSVCFDDATRGLQLQRAEWMQSVCAAVVYGCDKAFSRSCARKFEFEYELHGHTLAMYIKPDCSRRRKKRARCLSNVQRMFIVCSFVSINWIKRYHILGVWTFPNRAAEYAIRIMRFASVAAADFATCI